MSRSSIKDLHYTEQGRWHPLPEWGSLLAAAGAAAATYDSPATRLVIGAALPTRAFGAALTATEVVIARAAITRGTRDAGRELSKHFEELCRSARGTPVTLLVLPANNNKGVSTRRLKGVITECTEEYGERRLRITVEARGGCYVLAARDSWRIEPATATRSLPKRQTGHLVAPVKPLARHLLGEDAPGASDPGATRLDCVVLGRASQLEREVSGVDFAFDSGDGEFKSGALQDVLRARRFAPSDASFRSDILRVDGAKPGKAPGGLVPYVTVFDGARGFIRWRHLWRSSNWVVLLDRTAPHFEEAASALNSDFIQSRTGESDALDQFPVPPGVEVMAYTVARDR